MANVNLREYYKNTVVPGMLKSDDYSSIMAVPRLEKIVLNIGLGAKAVTDKKIVDKAIDDLSRIACQKAVVTKTRKSIAGFKIRDGWPIGAKVTLRDDKMYHFYERLVYLVLPRVRDFRGFKSNAFDGRGNISLGIPEYIAFPEINYEDVVHMLGMDVVIVTSTNSDKAAYQLLKQLYFPFTNKIED